MAFMCTKLVVAVGVRIRVPRDAGLHIIENKINTVKVSSVT